MEQDINNQVFTEEESGFDYKEWLSHFLRFWYVYFIAVSIALGVAYIKNRSWKANFLTSGTIILGGESTGQRTGSNAFMQGFGLQPGFGNQRNQVIMMRSYDFIGRVIDELPFLATEYITKGRFIERNRYRDTPIFISSERIAPQAYGHLFRINVRPDGSYIISLDDDKGNEIMTAEGRVGERLETNWFTITVQRLREDFRDIDMFFRFRSRDSLINEFLSRLQLGFVEEGSSVLRIVLISDVPARDVDFINKLCEVFIADNLALKNDMAVRTITFIDRQIASLQLDLNRSAEELTRFRESNQLIDFSAHAANITARQVDFENQAKDLEIREQFLNHLVAFLDDNISRGEIIVPPAVAVDNPKLFDLTNQLTNKHLHLAEITEQHITYDRTIREIEITKLRIFEEIQAMRLSLQLEKGILNRRMNHLQEEIRELPRIEVDMASIERRYRIEESYYTFFLQRRAEAEVQKASNRSDNSVLDTARVLYMTNHKAKRETTIKFLALGLALSFGFVLLIKLLNSKITTVSDVEKASAFPIIGSIRRTKRHNPMLLIEKPRSSFAEIFRVIRTRLEFIVKRKSNIMIAVSSTESGDGKTYFSANLAAVYAVTGRKTILVDMDIRKPNMHEFFNTSNEPGVTNYLIGDMELKDVIKKTDNEYYDLLTTGPVPPNPGEMIRSDKLKQMFEELKKEYEFIIVDTSPIGLVADAYAITLISDVNLFVTRLNKTRKAGIKKITEQLRDDKVLNIYTIINDVASERSHYSKYGSYYGPAYSYGGKFYSKKKREAAKNHARYYADDGDI